MSGPFIFISHDSRDVELAKFFGELLFQASAGLLGNFISSDRRGVSGLEFGDEWYKSIMSRIDAAAEVVALITHRSIDRPWILYEAGVAKGKHDRRVTGIAIGLPLKLASKGPFSQFQNSSDDEDSLTTLVQELVQRNTEANPSRRSVLGAVKIFKRKATRFIAKGDCGDMTDSEFLKYLEERVPLRDQDTAKKRFLSSSSNFLIRLLVRHYICGYDEALRSVRLMEKLPLSSGPRMDAAIEAVNLAKLHLKAVSILSRDQWNWDPRSVYLKANIRAAKDITRKVAIRRIIVVETEDEIYRQPAIDLIKQQLEAKIELKWLIAKDIERHFSSSRTEGIRLANILISDGQIMSCADNEANHNGYIVSRRDEIVKADEEFEDLWGNYASDLRLEMLT